ncbi:MAG: signal peptidase I [Ruminococcus sp.]|nr:signal peptidase I [Ruminococcus sp.]
MTALVSIVVFSMIVRLTGGTPSAFGYTVYRVSSGSMRPELEVGDVILVHDTDPMALQKGDIVTYDLLSDTSGNTITHRVTKPPFEKDGDYYIRTKGDANSYEDNDISITRVRGTLVCKISILSALYNFFITPVGLLTIILLIVLAFFNEIVNLVKAIMGIGFEEEKKESVQDIIERYQKENAQSSLAEEGSESEDKTS